MKHGYNTEYEVVILDVCTPVCVCVCVCVCVHTHRSHSPHLNYTRAEVSVCKFLEAFGFFFFFEKGYSTVEIEKIRQAVTWKLN